MTKQEKPQQDPTHRFEKLPEILSARTCVIQFKGYDTVTGIEVTWHEADIHSLTPEQRSDLVACVEVIKSLKCEFLLSLLHYWMNEEETVFYLITESLSSTSAQDQLNRDVPSLMKRAIARWFFAVLHALDFLHTRSRPIVHHRVFLSNIFVKATSGHVKLIPPLIDPFSLNVDDHSLKLRNTTPPEALHKQCVPASDIWMYGLALLRAVTQEEPYIECKSPIELIQKLERFEPPAALQRVDDRLVYDLIQQCLQPTSRRPTAAELMRHPFFQQDFSDSGTCGAQMAEGNNDLKLIYSGKGTGSHKEIPKVSPSGSEGIRKCSSVTAIKFSGT